MNNNYPLRHLSVRVPWHDSGWAGTVCNAPQLNGACAKLNRIAGSKKDVDEVLIAGRSLEELPSEQWPCCVDERGMFMAPYEMDQIKRHALANVNKEHYGHFRPTPQRYPAYSAGIVPFRWMMRESIERVGGLLELDVDESREPELGYESTWVHEARNQSSLLDGFAGHLREEDSLCLFYAKHVPFVEGTGRILVGAGRVKQIDKLTAYRQEGEGMPGMLWERPVQHSIRPKGQDGFLMPYQELLVRAGEDATIDLERYTASAPDEHWAEFSYASELVSHDGAIAALLSLDTALSRIESEQGIDTGWQREWLHVELVRLWKVRGPYPGLGAVLSAFGLSRGVFVAHALQQKAGENTDPWPLVDAAFREPVGTLPEELRRDVKELAPTWKGLPPERCAFLRLLSRFEINIEQANSLYEAGARNKRGWGGSDKEILANPYRLFELTRHDPEGVKLLTVDRGVFPDDTVRLLHPLDEPSQLESAVDLRRIRAFTLAALEDAALAGHTLLARNQIVGAVLDYAVRPPCPITGDMLTARAADMAPEVVSVPMNDDSALQLQRYHGIGDLVRKQVLGRLGGQRHSVEKDWADLLIETFGVSVDSEELRARQEKAAALKELAEARLSVLVGPAGAGKTSVLGILCAQSQILADGLLLLAPTGKARVRMQELAAAGSAKTLAQFLNQQGRYDGRTGRYHLSDRPKASGFGTVIVDESSMLTEDMIGALFDALQGVKRFIFVGDPAQLPPIGAGRPFVDIIAKLRPDENEVRFPRVAAGYAELTIERRQVGSDRADLRLARWFSATPPSVGEDDIFSSGADEHPTVSFVEWKSPEEFQGKLLDVLTRELSLSSTNDVRGFNGALGATSIGEYDYFNATRGGKKGSVQSVEDWQILSPLRGMPFGVGDINRQIHERFRQGFLGLATQRGRSIPKPLGVERIVYGDKVINLSNHRRDGRKVYPQEGALGYLANGEIGVAVGQWKTRGNPKNLTIEFASQKGFTYSFYGSDFREEGDASLELAYALTIHKSQGSQFNLVIVVLPEAHPILSRELIYTALTRHQNRVVVMHQGSRTLLKNLAAPELSATARRMTNLLHECRMLEIPHPKGSSFLQAGLVHRTSRGLAVRSKSELIICEALTSAGIGFEYEKPLSLGGGRRYPDFTIDDEISGKTFYWEHLGMLDRAEYRNAWNSKLEWYRGNGVLPLDEGGGPNGTLLTTTECLESGFDVGAVMALVRTINNS
ncbi:AAA family ATPase [Pseudomonas syringae]|uniref:AAA family ATPase n=1 Tax=Pseudomonas syringae TaxID=317 RepID=UPI003F755B7B